MKWLTIAAAARRAGTTKNAVIQRLRRVRNPLPHDCARDPDGAPIEPRIVLIRADAIDAEMAERPGRR